MLGLIILGLVILGLVMFGLVILGLIMFGLVILGLVMFGLVILGLVMLGRYMLGLYILGLYILGLYMLGLYMLGQYMLGRCHAFWLDAYYMHKDGHCSDASPTGTPLGSHVEEKPGVSQCYWCYLFKACVGGQAKEGWLAGWVGGSTKHAGVIHACHHVRLPFLPARSPAAGALHG